MDKFNSKTKLYPDGQKNTVFASKNVFSQPVEKKRAVKRLSQCLKSKGKCFSTVFLSGLPAGFSGRFFVRKIRHVPVPRVKADTSDLSREHALKRAHDKLFDLIYCNSDLCWFLSVTFNPRKVDSYDVPTVMVKLKVWLSNLVSRRGLKYILIPEYHKSGRIHCHLLVNDVFVFRDSGKLTKGNDGQMHQVFNVMDWKFGFSTAIHTYGEPIHVACYLTKYVTKQNNMIFGRYYWSSRNLKREPDLIFFDSDFNALPFDSVCIPDSSLKLKYLNEMRWNSYDTTNR